MQKSFRTRIFNISNGLTVLRILLLPPIVVLFSRGTSTAERVAIFLMILAALTDVLDGYLARRLNQKTDLGRVLDPISDKLSLIVVGFLLYRFRDFPLWALLLLGGRDLLFFFLGALLLKKTKVVPEARTAGKITTSVFAVTFLLYLFRLSPYNTILLHISIVVFIFSFFDYARRFLRVLQGRCHQF